MRYFFISILAIFFAFPVSAQNTGYKPAPDTFYGCILSRATAKRTENHLSKDFYVFESDSYTEGEACFIARPYSLSLKSFYYGGYKWSFMVADLFDNRLFRFQFHYSTDDPLEAHKMFDEIADKLNRRYEVNRRRSSSNFRFWNAIGKTLRRSMLVSLSIMKEDDDDYLISLTYSDSKYELLYSNKIKEDL